MTHLEVLGNLTDKPLEGQLADEELRRLLVATNFTEGDSTRPETVRLLHTTSSSLKGKASSQHGMESLTPSGAMKLGLTAAVFLAADFAASCLRGAFPVINYQHECPVSNNR